MNRWILLSLVVLAACTSSEPELGVAIAPASSASELIQRIRAGEITAEESTAIYLARIAAINHNGPMLQAIISLNPNALAEARTLDAEARTGSFRGALHGVPVLIKDNIETKELPTTAGSLALIDNNTGRDSPVVARLREQGAIILGKTNMSEWANFRSAKSIAGWSGLGGQTRNPHSLDRSPCGSSSGSAAAIAARLAPLALGTETNGSITCPAAMNGVVGFKPTVGLLSQKYIVPISSTQDSAGPITRTVRDAALLLTVMVGEKATDAPAENGPTGRHDYLERLDKGIVGMRIGVFRWADGNNSVVTATFDAALAVLKSRGATLIEITEFSPDPVMWESGDAILRSEFKHTLNLYLSDAAPNVEVESLADLIAFNELHADRELALFDQSTLIAAQQTEGIEESGYLEAVQAIRRAARDTGIDQLLRENNVEVLVMPTASLASPTDVAFTTKGVDRIGAGWLAAMAGYPILTVPMGDHLGLPLGLGIIGTYMDDGTVLAVGHAYEQVSNKIVDPTFARGPFDMEATGAAMRPYSHD